MPDRRKKIKKEKEELLCAVPSFWLGDPNQPSPRPPSQFCLWERKEKMEREMSMKMKKYRKCEEEDVYCKEKNKQGGEKVMGEYERTHAYFFGYGGNWGSFYEVEDGYIGELIGIPEEEYPDGYIYCGNTPAETFGDFLDAVYGYELVQERDRNPIEVEPLSEEEVEDMYCKFLKRVKEIE